MTNRRLQMVVSSSLCMRSIVVRIKSSFISLLYFLVAPLRYEVFLLTLVMA